MTEQSKEIENETNLQDDTASAIEQALASELDMASDNDGTEGGSVNQRLAQAQRDVLLAQAELENFRKRMQRENEQSLKYANMPLVRDLLDVIDNLNRATQAAKTDSTAADNNHALLSGVEMVAQQFAGVLAKYGCKPIESLGQPFDPNIHQAISQMPSEEHAAGTVAHEVAVGYLLHDRVVRPSAVIVSTGAAQS